MKVSNFQLGAAAWMLSQYGDLLTTYLCSLRSTGYEANPLIAMLWDHWGFGSVIALKVLFSFFPLLFLLFHQADSSRQQLGKWIGWASLITWFAVISNTLGLLLVR